MTTHLLRPLGAALLSALLATGCVSNITGNEGNLKFQYNADDDLLDFNKPIAVGAKLDLNVRDADKNKLVEITASGTDDDAVMGTQHNGHTVTLEAKGEGNVLVEVTAKTADGRTVTDSVNMMAKKAEVLKMRHYCTSETTGHYLVNNQVLIPYELERSNGQSVIGYGYHPFDIAPAGLVTLNETNKAQVHFWLDTGSKTGTATLTSTIDKTTLKMQLHEQGDIDGAMLEGEGSTAKALVGLKHYALVRPTIGGMPVCQANAEFTAEATASDVCTVKALTAKRSGKDVESGWGWVEVTPKKLGKCNFNVSFSKAKGGAGLVVPFEIPVSELQNP